MNNTVFESKLIERDELETLLPHKGKMFLLSRVTDFDVSHFIIETQFDVTRECIFFEEAGLPNWVTFEVMAQSISALTGISDKINGTPMKAGCLLSVLNFTSTRDYFAAGDTLCVKATEEMRDESSGVYRYFCELHLKGEEQISATATITALQVENLEELLRH